MWAGQGAGPGARPPHTHVLRHGAAKFRAMLVAVLLVLWSAVGQAGTPNAWSTVALSGDVPGRLYAHGTACLISLLHAILCLISLLHANPD